MILQSLREDKTRTHDIKPELCTPAVAIRGAWNNNLIKLLVTSLHFYRYGVIARLILLQTGGTLGNVHLWRHFEVFRIVSPPLPFRVKNSPLENV